jgi:hypothetical protein
MSSRVHKHRSSAALAQGGLCIYCCQALGRSASAEHLTARCDGGTDRRHNIAAALRRCNEGRHADPRRACLDPEAYATLVLLERRTGLA